MLEASPLRSRKHSASPTDTKNSSNSSLNSITAKTGSSIANDSGTSLSGSVEKLNKRAAADNLAASTGAEAAPNKNSRKQEGDGDVEMKEAPKSQDDSKKQSAEKRTIPPPSITREKLSAEDLNGGLLDGALDDLDDEDLDGDTEDTEAAQGSEGVFNDQDGEDDNEEHENEDDDKRQDSTEAADSDAEANDEVASGNKDGTQSQHSQDSDGDGDLTMGENDDDAEDEGSPGDHTDDEESDHPEDDESHADDDEDDAADADEADDDDDDDDVKPPGKPNDIKKDAASYPQKPVLNRPSQLIEEELKDSGDDLSDLSGFDDSDDSDDEVTQGPTKAKAGSNSSSATTTVAATRQAPGRKRPTRESTRDAKEQEEKARRDAKDTMAANDQHSDKESESETAENEDAHDDKADCEEDAEEEEDLEKKQLHMDALAALTTIEVEFAALRDKMYEERMLELDKEVEMIKDGTHPELSTLMKEIEDKREQRIKIAKAWRAHTGEIAQSEFEIKEYQAHCTFQSKKRELRVDIRDNMGRNIRKLGMDLTLTSDSRRKNIIADRHTLVRARKYRRMEVNELRKIEENHGFPASTTPSMVSVTELDEDFEAMGLPRPALMDNGLHYHGRSLAVASSPRLSSAVPQRWVGAPEYSTYNGSRSEVDVYVDGNQCKVDGIWYKPGDPVIVLEAGVGKYDAKYLFSTENDEVILQKNDGNKLRHHLNMFRARKLYMQPRP
ncbi:Sds3-like-domain-containing protein [Mortierella sp. GBAus27b]|nr:hypothetical protein BGX31_007752 [Mortierella sp. GBA43]KAI8358842.1 Sds3-like-domain-containing protein [Mortierella sp. GBAus27b]